MSLYSGLIIASTHSGVGKTTATLAILAALQQRGRQVQAFKSGPDFIDPDHHNYGDRTAFTKPRRMDVGGRPSIETSL